MRGPRTCLGCQTVKPKRQMIRIVRTLMEPYCEPDRQEVGKRSCVPSLDYLKFQGRQNVWKVLKSSPPSLLETGADFDD